MKTKFILILFPILSVSLTSCGQVLNYNDHLEDYVFTMSYHDDFNILQLSDIHWNVNSSTISSKQYLKKLFKEVDDHLPSGQKIDLVELTGDMFMLANTYHVESFINFMEDMAESYGFKYAPIWGNHDYHGIYNPNWLSKKFSEAEHSIFVDPDDNLYGRSNYVINLVNGSDTVWQIANLDSGASFSESSISPFREYDYIRKDQTDWWKKEHDLVGDNVPVIAYYHISQDENLKAYNIRSSLKNKFFKLEDFADNGNEEYESDFFDVAKDHGLKGVFMGHAHNIDWTAEYEGVVIGLGVKTGTELYFAHINKDSENEFMKEGLASIGGTDENFDLVGASLVTIKDDTSFDLEHLYFNERTSGDYVRWVKW